MKISLRPPPPPHIGYHSEHCRVGLVMGWCALVPHVSHHCGLPDLAVAVDQQANLAVVAALRAVAQRLKRDGMTKPAVLAPKDVSNLSRICSSSDPESGLDLNSAKCHAATKCVAHLVWALCPGSIPCVRRQRPGVVLLHQIVQRQLRLPPAHSSLSHPSYG